MWFVLLGIALLVVLASSIFFRRRLLAALEAEGMSARNRRLVGHIVTILLATTPAVSAIAIGISLAIGSESIAFPSGRIVDWLLYYPFWLAVLVVLQSVPLLVVAAIVAFLGQRWLEPARVRRLSARATLAIAVAFLIYTPARILLERDALDLNRYEVELSDTGTSLRIAFVADLQLDRHTDRARREGRRDDQPRATRSDSSWRRLD